MLGKEKNRETFEQAIKYFKKALELDPNYSQAYACLGFALHVRLPKPLDRRSRQLAAARQGIRPAGDRKGPERTAGATASAALAASFEKDLDRAQGRDRCGAGAEPEFWLWRTTCSATFAATSGSRWRRFRRSSRRCVLTRRSSAQFLHFLGMAYLLAGKYETAAALLRQRIILVPKTDFSRAVLASALGHLGEVDEARRVWARAHGDQSKVFVQWAHRPATDAAGGRRTRRSGAREDRSLLS